jgi:hypothetical protein
MEEGETEESFDEGLTSRRRSTDAVNETKPYDTSNV